MNNVEPIIQAIKTRQNSNETFLIAIDGRGGSGKSTLAGQLQQHLPNVSIVHADDLVYPMDQATRQRLLDHVILPLKENKTARYQVYDYKQQKLTDWKEIQPGGIVIIEGVSTLHDDLYKHYGYKIWVECPAEVGLQRGIARELKQYGKDTTKEWTDKYLPEEQKYIEENHPQEKADYIIDGTM